MTPPTAPRPTPPTRGGDEPDPQEEPRAVRAGTVGSDDQPSTGLFDDDAAEVLPPPDVSGHRVVVVLVVHDGRPWLGRSLEALARQTHRPAHVVAVDTGSSDDSVDLLERARAAGVVTQVLHRPDTPGFAAAVAAAVTAAPARPAGSDPSCDWLWVLHDDAAPQPDALAALLAAAHDQPSVAVLGPKVLGWDDPRRLLEVGVSISSSGRRETGLERHEQDQGQHDSQRDVLAVGSAGMLVRREVWDAVGGVDPRLTMFREDVDLGWRVNAAGHRVVVVPTSVVHHAEATARGRRPFAAGRPHRADRTSALYVLLANSGTAWLAFTWVRLAVLQLLRAVVLVLGKAAAEAADELAAAAAVLLRPRLVLAGRRVRRSSRSVPRRAFRELFPARGHQVRLAAEWVGGLVATGVAPRAAGTMESGPVDESSESFDEGPSGVWRERLTRPATLLGAGLLLVSLAAWRGLYRGGALHGGALLPMPAGAADLWHGYLQSWHPVVTGSPQAAPPSLPLFALWSAVGFGDPGRAVGWLLMLAAPLVGLVTWFALRPLRLSTRLRLFASVVYALSPSLVSAVAQGRLGTVLAALLLPVVGWAALRTIGLGGSGPGTLRSAAAGGLLLAVVLAFAPVLWLPSLVLALVAAPTLAADRAARLRLALVVVLPVALLLPWSLTWFTDPAQLFLESGLALTSSNDAAWHVLLLDPGGPVTVPLWLSVGLLVAAVASFARVPGRRDVAAGLVVAGVGLVWALVLAAVSVTPTTGTQPVAPWPGPALVLATAGLVVAVASAARSLGRRLSRTALSWRQPVVAVVVMLGLVVPFLSGAWWLYRGTAGPLVRSDPDPLPAFVRAQAAQPERVRTLVLQPREGRLDYTVLRDRPAQFGDVELAPSAAANQQLDSLVAEITSGRGGVAVEALLGYAVQFILVTAPVDPRLEATLDSVPGLVRVSNPGSDALWRVGLPTGRVQLSRTDPARPPLLLPSQEVDVRTQVPAATGQRQLLLAENVDPGWRATVDGTPLTAQVAGGWAQGFTVPADAGELVVEHDARTRQLWLLVEGVLVLATVVASLPARRRDEEVVL